MPDPLSDGQYLFEHENGLFIVMGAGTPIRVNSVTGLLEWAIGQANDEARSNDHGAWYGGTDWLGARTVGMDLILEGIPLEDVEAMLDELHTVFQPGNGTLSFKRRSKVQRTVAGRCRRSAFVADWDSWTGMLKGSLEMFCGDPRVYEDNLHVDLLLPPVYGAGRSYPRTYDYHYGGATGAVSASCENIGNFESCPVVMFNGPCANPVITNLTTGERIGVSLTLNAGDQLELDFDARSVILNGNIDRRSTVTSLPEWWRLHPGNNDIFYYAQSIGPSVPASEIRWRSAFISG